MPADFLANDFGAIARAMQRETASPPAVLHFWDMLSLLSSAHQSVEAAVAEAYAIMAQEGQKPWQLGGFRFLRRGWLWFPAWDVPTP